MRNIILTLLMAITVATGASAQGNTEVKVYLKDGTTGTYYTRSLLNYLDSILFLRTTGNAFSLKKARRVSTSEVDSVKCHFADAPSQTFTLVPELVNVDYKDNPLTSPTYPSLVVRLFDGKNVKAYLAYDPWFGYRVLYKTRGMERAQAIYKPNTKLKQKDRERLMARFNDYPEVVNYLRFVDANGWRVNPTAFLLLLDKELK